MNGIFTSGTSLLHNKRGGKRIKKVNFASILISRLLKDFCQPFCERLSLMFMIYEYTKSLRIQNLWYAINK